MPNLSVKSLKCLLYVRQAVVCVVGEGIVWCDGMCMCVVVRLLQLCCMKERRDEREEE
jgi:hypothetical protein